MAEVLVLSKDSKKAVKIKRDSFGLELMAMRNGWQWYDFGVDDELLDMLAEAIEDYKAMKRLSDDFKPIKVNIDDL